MPDHMHMFVRIPLKYSVAEVMGYLKGKSSLKILDRHVNLKYKYGSRHFRCRGYYVDTVGKNAKKIQEYIDLFIGDRLIGRSPYTKKVPPSKVALVGNSSIICQPFCCLYRWQQRSCSVRS